jgi:N-hydroxyarylamine O-acetyltransferase
MERKEIVQQYLSVLDVTAGAPSHDLLSTLTRRHVATFAFSGVGVRLHEDLPLDLPSLFTRIVADRRGGYCFEQNSLMFEVLQELGFDVVLKLARVIYGGDHLPGLTHRVTIATVDGCEYVVDVGFGALGPSFPVPLRQPSTHSNDWTYRVHESRPNEFHMQQRTKDGPFSLYRFDLGTYGESDCEIGHFYSQHHHEATFVNNLVASSILEEEIRSLRNNTYFVIRSGGVDQSVIESSSQLHSIFTDELGLRITEEEAQQLFFELPAPN